MKQKKAKCKFNSTETKAERSVKLTPSIYLPSGKKIKKSDTKNINVSDPIQFMLWFM